MHKYITQPNRATGERKSSAIESTKRIALLAMVAILLLFEGSVPTASATANDPAAITLTSPNPQPSVVSGFTFGAEFGASVAVSGSSLVVGAPGEPVGGLPLAGHAYIFNSTGFLIATLASPNPQFEGAFGWSVAVSDTSIVVGAPAEPGNGLGFAGHAYIFNSTGSLIATLTSPNAQSGGAFGWSVAASSTSVVVGAPSETASGFVGAGRAYVFNSTGSLTATLTSPNAQPISPNGGQFGFSVATSNTDVVVGARFETVGGLGRSGHAYIFKSTGSLVLTLTSPNAQTSGQFGTSVALSSTSIVVGAPPETTNGIVGAGHAYIFKSTGSLVSTLTSPNAHTGGQFGTSVALTDTSVVVGAPTENVGGLVYSGDAYVFNATGSLIASLNSPNLQFNGSFGTSVAASGTNMVAGASLEAASGFEFAGHAYVFTLLVPTSASVNCHSSSVTVNEPTLCTVTVTGGLSGSLASAGGTVIFSSTCSISLSCGSFSSPGCLLSTSSSQSSTCSVDYTPSPGSEGTHLITATYGGDGVHSGSTSNPFSLTVTQRLTSTTVSCQANTLAGHRSTVCTVVVTDLSAGAPIKPTGSVAWKSNGTGIFSPVAGGSSPCILSGIGNTTTCPVIFSTSPGRPFPQTITGTYSGDADHVSTFGTTRIGIPSGEQGDIEG